MREGLRSQSSTSARGYPECLKAADKLSAYGLSATVADARFAKPLDTALVRRLARESRSVAHHRGRAPSAGSAPMCCTSLAWDGLLDKGLKIRPLVLPDRFLDQDTPERMYEAAGLDAKAIVAAVLSAFGRDRDAAALMA